MINVFTKRRQVQLLKEGLKSSLKVGTWFRIYPEVIDKNIKNIQEKCNEAGEAGKKLLKSFEEANKIVKMYPEYYCLIETYIFEHNWNFKTVGEMQDMCESVGLGMCNDVICALELQMRICNGETIHDLVQKADELPCIRIIKLNDGGFGYFGGGSDNHSQFPPSDLRESYFYTKNIYKCTPYAFRRVFL